MAIGEQPEFIESPTYEEGASRDPDLERVYLGADKVGASGVQHLVNCLQKYRSLVRQAADFIDYQARFSERTTSIYRLKDHITAINSRMSELQFTLDLDHVDLGELTDGP